MDQGMFTELEYENKNEKARRERCLKRWPSRAAPVPGWRKFWLSPDGFRAILPLGRMTES